MPENVSILRGTTMVSPGSRELLEEYVDLKKPPLLALDGGIMDPSDLIMYALLVSANSVVPPLKFI